MKINQKIFRFSLTFRKNCDMKFLVPIISNVISLHNRKIKDLWPVNKRARTTWSVTSFLYIREFFLHCFRATFPSSFTTKWNIFWRASANNGKYSESCQASLCYIERKITNGRTGRFATGNAFEPPYVTEFSGVNLLNSRWLRTLTRTALTLLLIPQD